MPLGQTQRQLLRLFGVALVVFLRSTGLEILNVVIRSKTDQGHAEPKKPVVRASVWIALARCAVHILPILFSIVLLTLNLNGFFIGASLPGIIHDDNINLALLQVAAKVQELLIMASISSIIFDIVRNKLLNGDGVPLGLIGSGFAFKDISWFWSAEFCCSMQYETKWWKKTFLTASLLIAGILAITAGPAAAVLFIPRQHKWRAGGSTFFLKGLDSNIWPSNLTYDPKTDFAACSGTDATQYAVCPCGGFQTLMALFGQLNASSFQDRYTTPYHIGLASSTMNVEISSPNSQLPTQVSVGGIRNDRTSITNTYITLPHLSSSAYQKRLSLDWISSSLSVASKGVSEIHRYHGYSAEFATAVRTKNPGANARCSMAQNISIGGSAVVQFPIPGQPETKPVEVDIPSYNDAFSMGRFAWVLLDTEEWPDSTAGALFTFFSDTSDKSITVGSYGSVVACTVSASWQISTIAHTYETRYLFYNGEFGPSQQINANQAWLDALTPSIFPISSGNDDDIIKADNPPSSPTKGISSTRSSNSKTTNDNVTIQSKIRHLNTMEQFMQRARIQESLANSNLTMTEQWNSETLLGGGNRSTYLEFMLVCVFTDGLSRLGSVNVFTNTHLPVDKWTLSNYSKKPVFTQIILKGEGGGGGEALQPPPSGFDFTTLSVNVTIQDYAYKATSKTDYLAIAMIATHCVIALAHTIFSLLRGTSSSCWDSITEFLAVAWGSSGRYAELQNTGAGIRNGTTFKNKVWLRVQDPERKIVLTFNERGDPSTDPTSNTLLSKGKAEDAEGDEEEEPRCEESTLNIPLAAAANVSSAIEGNRESTRASHHT